MKRTRIITAGAAIVFVLASSALAIGTAAAQQNGFIIALSGVFRAPPSTQAVEGPNPWPRTRRTYLCLAGRG